MVLIFNFFKWLELLMKIILNYNFKMINFLNNYPKVFD